MGTRTNIARKTVELFYDVISPYSWIGFEVLCRYQNKWAMDLRLKPMFLGGVMQGADNQPPGMVPRKGMYMKNDIALLRQHYQIPLNFPENPVEAIFGVVSLPSIRFLTALNMSELHSHKVEEMSRQLFGRVWSKDLPINEPQHISEAAKAAGLNEHVISDLLGKIGSSEVKDKLKEVTQEALDHGAFGAPTIVTRDQNNEPCMLFGSDRFHILADVLGEKYEGPLLQYNKCKL